MRRLPDWERHEQAEDLVAQIRLKRIQSMYPRELDAICKLPSIRNRKDMLDHLKLELEEIVTKYRRRYADANYFRHIEECVRFTKSAATNLEDVADRLVKLDGTHIETLWRVAHEIDSNGFSKASFRALFVQVISMSQTLDLLAGALTVATGIAAGDKRGKGRPPNPYPEVAGELIELWERITAEQKPPPYNPDVLWIKPVSAAKKQVKEGEPDTHASEESTEFCRLVLRMIDPNLTMPQVRTAVNNARQDRKWLVEFLQSTKGTKSKEKLLLYGRFLQRKSDEQRRKRERRAKEGGRTEASG
jgi:hypothetical protein